MSGSSSQCQLTTLLGFCRSRCSCLDGSCRSAPEPGNFQARTVALLTMPANPVSMLAERLISGSRASTSRPSTGRVVQHSRSRTVRSDASCGGHPIAVDRDSPRTLVQPSWTKHSQRRISVQINPVCHRSGFTPVMVPSPCWYVCDRAIQSRSQLRQTALWPSATVVPLMQQCGATARLPARCSAVTAPAFAEMPREPRARQQRGRHRQRSIRR